MALLAASAVQAATPVAAWVVTVAQVVTTFVPGAVPAVQAPTAVTVEVVSQVVVTKLASVPATQLDAGATGVGPVVLALQVTVAKPLLSEGPAAEQLAAGCGPTTFVAQVLAT